MNNKDTISLVFQEKLGAKRHVMSIDSSVIPVFTDRYVDDIRDRPPFGGPSFDETVTALKERAFRRDLLKQAAILLAEKMADYLEDSEGWHGESRRDRIKEAQGITLK